MTSKTVGIQEVMARYDVTRQTASRWLRQGKIPSMPRDKGRTEPYRIDPVALAVHPRPKREYKKRGKQKGQTFERVGLFLRADVKEQLTAEFGRGWQNKVRGWIEEGFKTHTK